MKACCTRALAASALALAMAAPAAADYYDYDTVPLGDSAIGVPRLVPSNNFEEYKGGFDITNDAYLESCGFMGMPAFVVAILLVVIYMIIFIVEFLRTMCACLFCCCKKDKDASEVKVLDKTTLNRPIYAMGVFTVLCVLACILIYVGGPATAANVSDMTDVMVDAVNSVAEDVSTVSTGLSAAAEVIDGIDTSSLDDLDAAMAEVQIMVNDNADDIKTYLEQAAMGFVVVACMLLGLCVFTMGVGVMGWSKILVLMCWIGGILLVISWVFFGVASTTYVVAIDLCDSMKLYLEDPSSSDLSSVMPCLEAGAAIDSMNLGREVVLDAVNELNAGLEELLAFPLYSDYDLICPEFRASTAGEICSDGGGPGDDDFTTYVCEALGDDTISSSLVVYPTVNCPHPSPKYGNHLEDFEDDYAGLVCGQGNDPVCMDQADFDSLVDVSAAGVEAVGVLPASERIVVCQFVTDAFTELSGDICTSLDEDLNLLWIGFLLNSIVYLCLWVTWVVAAKRYGNLSEQKQAAIEMRAREMEGGVAA